MFKNMKLGTKISGGFAILIIIALILSFTGWNGLQNVEELAQVTAQANLAKDNLQSARGHIKDFINQGFAKQGNDTKNSVEKYTDVYAAQKELLNEMRKSSGLSSSDLTLIDNALRNIDEYDAGVQGMVAARKQKDASFEQWGKLGWSVTNDINSAMENIINPAKRAAENSGNINQLKIWNEYGVRLDQDVVEKFLVLRVTAVYLVATNADAQWTAYQEQLAKMKTGLNDWASLVQDKSDLARTAATIHQYIQEYEEAGIKFYEAIVNNRSEYQDVMTAAASLTDNINKLQAETEKESQSVMTQANTLMITLAVAGMIVGILLALIITRGITGPINRIIKGLTSGAEQVGAASEQVAAAGQSLAEGASEQASSLEETSSSLEEMASMTRQNADNAKQASTLADEANKSSAKGAQAMQEMSEAMEKIKKSSDETAKIIKVIDEIAFQTNLLALNAAVEAARAGEAGKGFAVVAEEVRNLAQRSAEAAKNTNALIEGAQKNAENGVRVTELLNEILQDISNGSRKVTDLINEVSVASNEQTQGIDQLNTAMSQMDQVTQQNASNAEESSSASEELAAQAQQLQEIVGELAQVVHGANTLSMVDISRGKEHHDNGTGGLSSRMSNRIRSTLGRSTKAKTAGNVQSRKNKDKAVDIIPLKEEEMAEF
nr:hypothetical protein [candidate division Zixibacteria bacterium]